MGSGAVSDGFVQGLWDVVLGDAIRAAPMSEADVAALLDRLTLICAVPSTSRASPGMSACPDTRRPRTASRTSSARSLPGAVTASATADQTPRRSASCTSWTRSSPSSLTAATLASPPRTPPGSPNNRSASHWLEPYRCTRRCVRADRQGHVRANHTGAEIDFVGPDLEIPFECKYTDGNWRNEPSR